MTTIAWDGKTLAADRRVTCGGVTDAKVHKIVRREDGALAGSAGNTSLGAAFKRWFLSGEPGERPPLSREQETANGVIIRPSGLIEIHDVCGWYEAEAPHYALGSGWEIALGAMAAGASAEEAVRIAAKLDGNTGDEVETLTLPPPPAARLVGL